MQFLDTLPDVDVNQNQPHAPGDDLTSFVSSIQTNATNKSSQNTKPTRNITKKTIKNIVG